MLKLLWKEWHENLWKLGFGLTASAAFTVMLFRIRLFPDMANCRVLNTIQMWHRQNCCFNIRNLH